jgi:LacI family transcriptional regulator
MVDTSTNYGTQIIEGVARFVREHRSWQLLVQPRGEQERSLMPKSWQVDGVIARVTHRALAQDLRQRRVPVVNVSMSTVPGFTFPQVTIDGRKIGLWSAEYLKELGLRNFGYCGVWNLPNYVDRCGPVFLEELRQGGFECHVIRPQRRGTSSAAALTVSQFKRWLRSLPKPIGIFAADVEDAHNLREACRDAGLNIPDEIALLCGEDDRLLSTISYPPLSCIDLATDRVGYKAAAVLGQLLAGRRPPVRPVHVPPLRVVPRHSTDMLAMEDRDVATAVRFIREHVSSPISVPDILEVTAMSRRALEQRFQRLLGRSPAEEIRRVRLDRAKELLIITDRNIPDVASTAGFSCVEVMNQTFRRELNLTPTEFRQRSRAGG